MTSKYQQLFTIPDGFAPLVKSLAREILRAQPGNVYEFGARYFAELLEQQKGAHKQPLESMSQEEKEDFILSAFLEADVNHSGCLSRTEFAKVLKADQLVLKPWQIRKMMAEATDNEDGSINYQELIPVFSEIINTQQSIEKAIRSEKTAECLMNGVGKEEFQRALTSVVKKMNSDALTSLGLPVLKKVFTNPVLGLTKKDVNLLLGSLEVGQDGCIAVEDVLIKTFDVLIERHEDVLALNQCSAPSTEILEELIQSFSAEDTDASGMLPCHTIKKLLQAKSWDGLGLTSFHIAIILSSVAQNANQEMEYKTIAKTTAEKVAGFHNLEKRKLRQEAMNQMSCTAGAKQMNFASPATVEAILYQTFKDADTDGAGYLKVNEVKEVMEKLASSSEQEFQIPKQHLDAVFFAIDADENSNIDYQEIPQLWTGFLDHVTREDTIQEIISAAKTSNTQK